jgi:hypothetical protein
MDRFTRGPGKTTSEMAKALIKMVLWAISTMEAGKKIRNMDMV